MGKRARWLYFSQSVSLVTIRQNDAVGRWKAGMLTLVVYLQTNVKCIFSDRWHCCVVLFLYTEPWSYEGSQFLVSEVR